MSTIKNLLLQSLGEQKYLRTLCTTFQKLLWFKILGKDYQDVYFLKKHIHKGDICIDIGAHLGYYCFEISRLAGKDGIVYAIEPISKFNSVIEGYANRYSFPSLTLFKVALGGESTLVEMGIPQIGTQKKFAYARIIQQTDTLNYVETEVVKNEDPNLLFGNLPKIDFIKCDVEGFEVKLFSKMIATLEKYHPKLLCELADLNERRKFYELVKPLGYECYLLFNGKLEKTDVYGQKLAVSHNHYFMTAAHAKALSPYIV